MKPEGTFAAGGRLFVADQAVISCVITKQQAAGCGFRNPMYRAALVGEIRLAELLPHGTVPASLLVPEAPPTLIVVNDDSEPVSPSLGPAGFPQARRLASWCRAALLHSTGGQEWHYAMTAEWTRRLRRVLLIETSTAREPEWRAVLDAEALRRIRAQQPALHGLRILAHPGQSHPAMGGAA